jgi:hypothetical protein
VRGLRDHISAYDAMYVALAEAIEAPMLTTPTFADSHVRRRPGDWISAELRDALSDGCVVCCIHRLEAAQHVLDGRARKRMSWQLAQVHRRSLAD